MCFDSEDNEDDDELNPQFGAPWVRDLEEEGWKFLGTAADYGVVYAKGGLLGSVINLQPRVLSEDKIEFVSLLFADDQGALTVVEEFWADRRKPEVTEVNHTLWTGGQRDQNGMFVYHVNHNLNTENVLVSLDSTELFTYSVLNENTVVVVCPESLWGVDVTVMVRES